MWSKMIGPFMPKVPTVNCVHLKGVIRGGRGRGGISFTEMDGIIKNAFTKGYHPPDAVALVVNSPGGSPVQSAMIGERIRQLAAQTKIPVLGFAEDVAASGGMWLLASADEIYASKSSIVGSIGVVSAGFGFADALPRIGMERRLYTAGKCKARLDPFQPAKPEDISHAKEVLEEIHVHFKSYISERRGEKIKGHEAVVFSGDYFTGQKGVELGLVDKIGHLHVICQEKFGDKVKINVMNPKRFVFPWDSAVASGASSSSSYSDHVVSSILDHAEARIEEQILRNRIGL